MSRPAFASGFAAELDAYIDMKVACGFKERSFAGVLAKFDRFCAARGIDGVAFTRDDADEWERRLPGEATTTFYARVNKSKGFLDHLVAKGVPGVRSVRDVPFRPTAFRPHVYTDGEVASYFREVDAWSTPRSRPDEVQFPVLFRTLYCCGTRVGETLGIRKRDVDLGAGTVVLNETKNDRQRLVALGPQMAAMYSRLADKEFYLLGDDDYVFGRANGGRRSPDSVYEVHRELLRRAGIPYVGGGEGPRVHDWRHTFAVRAFKRMVDGGADMYVALPVLSTYLGHRTIYATERYVRLTMEVYPHVAAALAPKLEEVFGKGGWSE